jgi:bifunctional pyridoxal-dependent enzyme with beta-cystathionase and maltose regulon repressor activities
MIAPGHVYGAEERGWIRITFTVEEDALIAGLCRLGESLDELGTSINC